MDRPLPEGDERQFADALGIPPTWPLAPRDLCAFCSVRFFFGRELQEGGPPQPCYRSARLSKLRPDGPSFNKTV